MALRRSSFNCKLKTRVIILSIILIFISISLLYRALMYEDGSNSLSPQLFPTLGKKRPVRFQSKHKADVNIDPMLLKHTGDLRMDQQPYLSAVKDRDLLNADSKEALSTFLSKLYPVNWAEAPETDDLALELKYLLLDSGIESKMSCKDIDSLRLGHAITFTRTKYIEYGYVDSGDTDYNNNNNNLYGNNGEQSYNSYSGQGRRQHSDLAVKSPSNDRETKIECMKQIYDPELCSTMGNYRFLREVLLMSTLHHPNIPVLKGYCLRGKSISHTIQEKGLILITEVGSPLTQSLIYTSTLKQRVSYALQISELLRYLDTNSIGSLRLAKIELKDFLLTDSTMIKLVDLDDLMLERKCTASSDCLLPDSDKGVDCLHGVCDGFNSLFNLDLVSRHVLLPLLHKLSDVKIEKLVEKLQILNTDIEEMCHELRIIYSHTPDDPPPNFVNRPVNNEAMGFKKDRPAASHLGYPKDSSHVDEEMAGKKSAPLYVVNSGLDGDLSHFQRFDKKNYPGIFDYPCAGSRVSWGCVLTVTSLSRAATHCYNDPACKAFVTFSTQPEVETLMTILLKNETDTYPQTSSGTTLFIKSVDIVRLEKKKEVGVSEEEDEDDDADKDEDDDDLEEEEDEKAMIAIHECVERTSQTYESARHSREKRLMTHLGLKGIPEQSWRRSALEQNIGNFSRIVKAGGGGGKFQVKFENPVGSDHSQVASKATFVAEDGPRSYHLAYGLAYHLDRILGFYHTPPCIGKKLMSSALVRFQQSSNWMDTFQPLIESDGALSGILMMSVPHVMKLGKLTLQPLNKMISQVKSFERPDKLQLEYMVLSWLTGMTLAKNDHIGYKGHFIHFGANLAFRNTSVNHVGYLNHCQFPNVAYKSLVCFRCSGDVVGTTICYLGEEAAMRLRSMFEDEVELNFYGKTEKRYTESINAVASRIMLTVDQCIKTFGRENVLY